MNLFLSLFLFFTIGLSNNPQQVGSNFKISTFTDVPKDLQGCGDSYYLSENQKKAGNYICCTDYITALIYLNGKPVRLKANYKISDKQNHAFTNGSYILIIKNGTLKQTGDETYAMNPVITLKVNSKVIWTSNLVGESGC